MKQCKQAHTRTRPTPKTRRQSKRVEPEDEKRMLLLGEKFAAATRKSVMEDEDSDVDLDFLPDQATFTDSSSSLHPDAVNPHLSTGHVGAGLSPTQPPTIPFSSFSILQRIDHAPGPIQVPDVPFVQNPAMPIHHSALSRAFVKTIGRLGRWKRVLNARAIVRSNMCVDGSSLDLDMLTAGGGVEDYLSRVTAPSTTIQHSPSSVVKVATAPSDVVSSPAPPPSSSPPATHEPSPDLIDESSGSHTSDSDSVAAEEVDSNPEPTPHENTEPLDCAASFRSTSTDSFGAPLTSGKFPFFPAPGQAPWQFDVASIDDLELSDTSSDFHVVNGPSSPPGLRRLPRKLPLRRDFEFIRRETVSSMGIATRESVASNASSVVSSSSATGLGGNIAQWQLNSLIDSLSADEESGDVEDALRRLEGQINPVKQQEKASKVDGWVRTMRKRMLAGDYVDEPPRFVDEDFDEETEENAQNESLDSLNEYDSASQNEVEVPPSADSEQLKDDDLESKLVSTPIATQTTHVIPPGPTVPTSNSGSPTHSDAKPAPEDAVPLEILQSRVPSRPSTASSQKAPVSRFIFSDAARIYRSWVLGIRTAVLANHYAMIDRDIFMGVKFEELVMDDWMRCEEVHVLDWLEFENDRARWKAESRFADKTTALVGIRGRFNIMANFVISEIVLTPPQDRPLLVAKFIRIAWVSTSFRFSRLVSLVNSHARNHTSCVILLAWLRLLLVCKVNG